MQKCGCLSRWVTHVLDHLEFDFLFCLVSKDKQYTFILGKHDSAKWDAGAGPGTNPTISYSYEAKQVLIELNCTNSATSQLDAVGEGPPNFYKFRLKSKCSCWNGCKCK